MANTKVVGSNTPKKRFFRILMVILIIGLCLLMLSPFIWMIGASLKKEADVMKQGVGLFPTYWYPQNYLRVLGFAGKTNYHFLQGYWNSIKVAAISAAVAGVSSCLAGYAFAKLKFRGSNVLFLLYLSQMMIPSQLTLIPRFVIFSAVGLVNTHWALILPKVVAVSATFMMRQAFLGTSEELREAAKIDGASEFRIFYQIMVPIIIPTIAAVCTTQFVSSWNSYMDPLIFINKSALYTLPLVLDNFVSMEATQYGLMMAACCLATVPVFIVFLCGQKFFIKGLTVGAVKGQVMNRKTKGYIVGVISILFSVFLIVLALALSNLAKGDTRERSQDTADYRKWSVPEKYTHFLIFPEEIPAEAEEVEYYYQYESGWDRPMSQIYLSYRLNENAYATEQERLSSLTYTDRTGETRSVEYDTASFGYPAYVTIAGYDFCYEYALLNEKEHTIVYIYAMNTVSDDLQFNDEFLPNYYMENFDDLAYQGKDHFTIYGGYDE